MPVKQITFTCCNSACNSDPESPLTVRVPEPDNSAGQPTKLKVVYCKNGHECKIRIPATWDVIRIVLGKEMPSTDAGLPPFESEPT